MFNVSESGSHLRCCTTRSKRSCKFDLINQVPVDALGQHFRVVLVMQGSVTLTPPKIPDLMDQVLSIVRMSSPQYWNFSVCSSSLGCSLNFCRVCSCRLKNTIFRHLRRLALRFPLDLHRRRPLFDTKVCITLRSNEVGLLTCGVCASRHRTRLTTHV